MMKKKICFYSILSSGHLNVCISIASLLLDKYSDSIEVWFILDNKWHNKISKIDSRYKFGIIQYDNLNVENRLLELVDLLEKCLQMNVLDKLAFTLKSFFEDKSLFELDSKSEEQILKIKPDFLICDQPFHLPAMYNCDVPFAFLCSCSPNLFRIEGYPIIGSDVATNDKDGIKNFNKKFEPFNLELEQKLADFFVSRNCKWDKKKIRLVQPLSDEFNLYAYPQELDFLDEKIRNQYKLWQFDTPLYKERIPKPYEITKEFADLPGKIIYVSLGSLFSKYIKLIEKLINILDKFPYKYIVSKGPDGDQLKFPSKKFIGECYIDQLAVLQIADGMIAHGGNNTFGECFYFGVPSIILPILGDQINNAVRIEETGYGYHLDVIKYTEEEMADRLSKITNDKELKLKLKKISERIQKEERILSVVDKIFDYIQKK